jgi:putative transposase
MLHSYTKIFIHLIWSTKGRQRFLNNDVRPLLHRHFLDYARQQDIAIDALNVQMEHVHAFIHLRSDQKVDDVVKMLKGESSHWINSENLIQLKFSWQRGYGAFSVSVSQLTTVRRYINNQDRHHAKKTFCEKVDEIVTKYGFGSEEINKGEQFNG